MRWKHRALAMGLTLAMAASLAVGVPAQAQSASDGWNAADTSLDATGRTVSFNAGWKFAKGNPANAQSADFDDSGWQDVTLPHDWRITEDFAGMDSSKAAAKAARGYLPYGTVWYRKSFTLNDQMKGKRIAINFDGVQSSSALYVNGKAVGVKSTDGYTQLVGYDPFSEDITDYLDQNGENVIAVKATVSDPTSRWYEGGGIYRDVTLSVTQDVHAATDGTYITTPIPTAASYNDGDSTNDFSYSKDDVLSYIAGGKAQVDIATDVRNDGAAAASATVTTDILDGETVVASATSDPVTVDAGGRASVPQTVQIASPKLWSTDAPNLYEARTTIAVNGAVVDTTTTDMGVRYLTYTSSDGFYLNGQYTKIRGMAMHADLGALGMAFNERAAARQIEILKAAGVNAIRTAHNPAARKFIDLANRMGVMVLEEIGEEWTGPKMGGKGLGTAAQKTVIGDNEWNGKIWLEKELKSMIARDRSAPSVIMWSLGNEITASQLGQVAAAEGQFADLDENLVKWAKEVDATRPTTMNNYREMGAAQTVLDNMDVAGYSYLDGRVMSEWHQEHPDWINVASESGSHLESRGKYYNLSDPIMGELSSVRDDKALQLSAYDAYQNGKEVDLTWNHEIAADYSIGEFNWTGFDYIGEPTPYAGDASTDANGNQIASKSSYFGIVDTAGLPKDSYYLYQSLWTDRSSNPMVHLVPSNWNWEQGQKIDVIAYSNAMSVELFLNGKSLGVRSFNEQSTRLGMTYRTATDRNTIADAPGAYADSPLNDFYLTWDDVAYEPGELKAVAYSQADGKGDVIAQDVLATSSAASALRLTPDRRLIDNSGYDDDLSFITVEATDANGTLVPDASNAVTFQVKNGTIAGVDNGDGASLEKWQTGSGKVTSSYRSLFSGKAMLIVRSDGSGKPIEVTAQSAGLADATATVYTTAGDANAIVELLPQRRSTNAGTDPTAALPATVEAVYGDGHTAQLPVAWRALTADDYAKVGVTQIEGTVAGTTLKAQLTLAVNGIVAVQPVTAAVNAGTDIATVLPSDVTVAYSDGATASAGVTWDAKQVAAATEAAKAEGTVRVEGAVNADTTLKATASIRVVKPGTEERDTNIAGTAPTRLSAVAAAGKTFEEATAYPATQSRIDAAFDGVVDFSLDSEWTNYVGSKGLPAAGLGKNQQAPVSWLGAAWNESHAVSSAKATFKLVSKDKVMPSSVTAEYLDPATGTYVEVSGLAVTETDVSDHNVPGKTVTLTFDPVATTSLLVRMDRDPAPVDKTNLYVSELEINEKQTVDVSATPNDTAALSALAVRQNDGDAQAVDGFAADRTAYSLTVPWTVTKLSVEATAADNAGVYVIPPMSGVAGLYRIVVTSESGRTAVAYTLTVQQEQAPLASVTATISGASADGGNAFSMEDGDSGTLEATALGGNGTPIVSGVTFAYASSDDTVVAVTQDGVVTANGAGTATLTVTARLKDQSVTTELAVTVHDSGRVITAVLPVAVTVMKGAQSVTLPDAVGVTFATGPEGARAVTWDAGELAAVDLGQIGRSVVTGTVKGTDIKAKATVTVHDVIAVEHVAVATPVGALPQLPETAIVYYSDGTDAEQAVTWKPLAASDVAHTGFATATGSIAFEEDGVAVTRDVTASVRVADEVLGENRILYQTNAFPQVSADHSVSATALGYVNDGDTTYAGDATKRWTNAKPSAAASDATLRFVLGLANETAYDFNKLTVRWYESGNEGAADTMTIKYRNADGDMVPVTGQSSRVVEAPQNGKVVEYSFDDVNTSRFELVMHRDSGVMSIVEVEGYERLANAQTVTQLTGLTVGSTPVDGFDPAKTDYAATYDGTTFPAVEPAYDQSANPGVTVVPASSTYPAARVIVRSEDRAGSATYTVTFTAQQPEPDQPDPDQPGNPEPEQPAPGEPGDGQDNGGQDSDGQGGDQSAPQPDANGTGAGNDSANGDDANGNDAANAASGDRAALSNTGAAVLGIAAAVIALVAFGVAFVAQRKATR